jgi:hypothetical protein
MDVTVAVAPEKRDVRDVSLEISTRAEEGAAPVPLATLQATALRPLQPRERIAFTLSLDEDGALVAACADEAAGVDLRVRRLDDGARRAPVNARA